LFICFSSDFHWLHPPYKAVRPTGPDSLAFCPTRTQKKKKRKPRKGKFILREPPEEFSCVSLFVVAIVAVVVRCLLLCQLLLSFDIWHPVPIQGL